MTSTESSSTSSGRRDRNQWWYGDVSKYSRSRDIKYKRAVPSPLFACPKILDDLVHQESINDCESLFRDHQKLASDYRALKEKCKSLEHNEAILCLYYTYYKNKSAKLKTENIRLSQERKKIKQLVKHLNVELKKQNEKNEKLRLKLDSIKSDLIAVRKWWYPVSLRCILFRRIFIWVYIFGEVGISVLAKIKISND